MSTERWDCPCGVTNPPGRTTCRGCGTAFDAAQRYKLDGVSDQDRELGRLDYMPTSTTPEIPGHQTLECLGVLTAELEKRIGTTPRARLKWLLEVFLYADLKGASDQMWAEWLPLLNGFAARGTLRWLVSPRPGKEIIITRYDRKAFRALPDSIRYELKRGWIDSVRLHKGHPTATEDERLEIIRCQGALRDLFEGLARGRLCTPDLGNLKLICRIGPAQPGKPGPHLLVRHYYGPLFAKLLLAALDQLEAVGPNRLRVCPFQEPGRRITIAGREGCGRVFIAAKGQIYCSRLHSAKASYLRWKNRGFPRRHRQKKTFPNTIG